MKKGLVKRTVRSIRGLALKLIPLFSVLSLAACSLLPESLRSGLTPESAQEPQPEILIPVTRGHIASSMYFIGNLEYSQSATLTWKTAGVVESVKVKVGDRVKKGDILAVLATDSLSSSVILAEKTMIEQQEKLEDIQGSELARMEAYSNLNAKESALKTAKLEQEALYYPRATREEMERAWDSLALAHLNFNYAKQDYDYLVSIGAPWTGKEKEIRIRRFGRTFRVSGADDRSGRERKFEDYVSAYNTYVSAYEKYKWVSGEPSAVDYAVAEGNVRVAQMEYDKALEEYMSYEVLPRQKDVNAAEVSLKNAESSYNQRFIIAQFDGTVTSVSAVEGYYVTRGSTAMRVDDMSRIYIPLNVPELDFSSVTSGTKVTVSVDAIPEKTYAGHLYSIADASEVSDYTTAFSAMVEVDAPDSGMLAGMTAEIAVPVHEKNDAVLIPVSAITYTNDTPYVTVVSGNVRQTLEVRLGIVLDQIAEVVSSNVKEGSKVVVNTITGDTLKQLGLDPADYAENTAGDSRQDRPASSGGSVPDRQFPGASEHPAAAPASEPASAEVMVSPTETSPEISEPEKPSPAVTETPAGDPARVPPKRSDGESPVPDADGESPRFPEGERPSRGGRPFPGGSDGRNPGMSGDGDRPQPPEGSRPSRGGADGSALRDGESPASPTSAPAGSGVPAEKG